MKRLQEDFRFSALLVFACFLETGSLTDPRLEVSTPWFSSVCPLKHWGYIGMAAPNVRKKFNYYYFGWGQLCTRQLVLSFHLSMGYEDWAGCYTKCLYLCLHGYWESELGGPPPWVLLPAFPAPQIHSGGTLGQTQSHLLSILLIISGKLMVLHDRHRANTFLFVYLFGCLSNRSFIHPSTYLFDCLPIHPFIYFFWGGQGLSM